MTRLSQGRAAPDFTLSTLTATKSRSQPSTSRTRSAVISVICSRDR